MVEISAFQKISGKNKMVKTLAKTSGPWVSLLALSHNRTRTSGFKPWCLHIETRFHYAAEGARDVLYKMLTIEERVRSKLEIRSYVCACTLPFGV